MKKIFKILLWVVGIVLALLIVVSLLGGPIAKGYLNGHSESIIGRHVEVKKVGLNLLTGQVKIQGLQVYEDDGTTPFAGFDTLDVRAAVLQLPFHTLNLRHITLCGLHANILQEGERFNFSSIIDHFSSDKKEEDKDTTPSNWTLKFRNIHLRHARLHYNDLRSNKGISLPDVNLRVPGFVLGGKEATEGGLNLRFSKGGQLNANADLSDNRYNIDLDLTDFSLENVEGYVQDFIDFDDVMGTLAAHVSATGSSNELLKSRISATINLTDVALRDDHRQTLAGLDRLNIKVNNINLDANSYDIAEVHLDGLTAIYEQYDGYSNFSRLIKVPEDMEETEIQEDSENTNKKTLQLRVGELEVTHCNLTYVNTTLPDEFRFPLTDVTINASDIKLHGENNARIRASLPGGGHLAVRWKGILDPWKQQQDLILIIKGLQLKQLSPWAVAYTGQPIEDGIFSLTSRNNISNSQLNGQNIIDIYKPVVGKKRKDLKAEKQLPLKTALYVLKDKDDKIQLDVPVKGNIDNPEFNYMKLVWKTLGNLIVKVATSPARALGNALGIDGEGLDFLAIDPEQHGLTSEQYHTLGQLASVVQSDSLIVLRMELHLNDTERAERFNNHVRHYLLEQGVNEHQIEIFTGDAPTESQPSGYTIISELKIEE